MGDLRRERNYSLVLTDNVAHGAERVLTSLPRSETGGPVPSKRYFRTAPDGRSLAWWDEAGARLHVLDSAAADHLEVDRVPDGTFRFSPDGRLLAVARTAASSPEMDVDVFDLASGTGRTLGRFSTVESLEWLRDGLVVQHTVDTAEGVADEAGELHTVAELTYVPLAGASRLLWSGERLDGPIAAASRGGRVTFFAGGKVLSADALRPGSVPLVHGSYLGEVRNVEVSPFGGRAAFVTWDGVYVVEGDGAPREIDALGGVHTIWFSDDGAALAYASPARAVFVTRDTVAYLDATALDLRALRFRRDAPGLLVSFQHELVAWDPTTGTKKVLATVKAPEDLEGADVYTGGKLLWRSKLEASKGTLLD